MPYDSHATLHHKSSFFGLHLPFSMKNSLADAMRAYYTQRLMWDINTNLAVTKPLIEYLLDAKSVLSSDEVHNHVSVPDYLITFLIEWQSKSNSLIERMEELAIEFYEKSFWDVEEVYSIQKWIRDLMMAGYKFPQISPALNEVDPFQEEECQITDVRTQTDEIYKDKVDTVKRGKLEMFLRMSAESTTLLDFYYLVFDWSLRFFWHNEVSPLNLLLILDDEKEKDHKFGEEREKVYPFPTLHFEKPNSYYGTYGHSRMQWSMFWADQYATGDYVGFVDTDSLFISLVYEDLLFEGDKPIVWGLFGGSTNAWWGHVKSSTYQFLKEKEVVKAMNYFPVIVKVEHFAAVRHHIELVHGKPFNDVFQSMMFTKEYSQFNIIFTFLWYFHRHEYVWHMEETKGKNYDGPNELTEFHDVTDEMRTPYPKLSIHFRYLEGIKVKVDTWFDRKSINKAGQKTRNNLMLEGYCYSYGYNNTPEMCAKFDINAVQETLFEFEDHTWSWDERCLVVQQKHYSSLTGVKHKWDPDILAAISRD